MFLFYDLRELNPPFHRCTELHTRIAWPTTFYGNLNTPSSLKIIINKGREERCRSSAFRRWTMGVCAWTITANISDRMRQFKPPTFRLRFQLWTAESCDRMRKFLWKAKKHQSNRDETRNSFSSRGRIDDFDSLLLFFVRLVYKSMWDLWAGNLFY